MDWPRENERLFVRADDWHRNACLGSWSASLGGYAGGYRDAADALLAAIERDEVLLDAVIHPYVFLWRQYLELTLKELVDTLRRLEHSGCGFPLHHDLRKLWREAALLARQHYAEDLPTEMDSAARLVEEFMSHDPGGDAFRFPTNRDGSPVLEELGHINVRNLSDTMHRLGDMLDCLCADVAKRLDWKAEMERDG